jgi:hypothetical protein
VPAILLIDDDADLLHELSEQIRTELPEEHGIIRTWQPTAEGAPPLEQLATNVGDDIVLVVTDFDLSRTRSGILGDSIIRWCQRRALPAALYTRGDQAQVPAVPDLFELKIPRDRLVGRYIADLYRGFVDVNTAIGPVIQDHEARSPAAVLAQALGNPDLEYELAQYTVRLGDTSGALTTLVRQTAPREAEPPAPSPTEIRKVLTYVLGHLMVNAILPYPGPLLPIAALCGYIGTTSNEAATLASVFEDAAYGGPFGSLDRIFWRLKVDDIIEQQLPPQEAHESYVIRRRAVERTLGRELERHECTRCGGVNGGFFCPFTRRAVCERGDCSTASTSWLPLGATACRIEAEFFEEWAPLLGY